MVTRRTFLMIAISTSAIGAVALITSRLGSGAHPAAPEAQTGAEAEPNVGAEPGQGAAAAGAAPLVLISREQWGAAEPQISAGAQGEHGFYEPVANPDGWMVYERPLEEVLQLVIIHHSALPLSDGPLQIQQLHTQEFGFADIGYQFLIDEKGQLFEGRSLEVRGAHTYNYNEGSVGICLIGNFEEIEPTAIQLSVLNALLTDLVTRFPGINRLAGHKDSNPGKTLCPGQNLYPLLPGIAEAHGLLYKIS